MKALSVFLLVLASGAARPDRDAEREEVAARRGRRLTNGWGDGGGWDGRRHDYRPPAYGPPPVWGGYPPAYNPPIYNPIYNPVNPIYNPINPIFNPPIAGGNRALLRWFGSPLCNTQGGGGFQPPSLVLVSAGVCNVASADSSYQVLCRADRSGGAIRFCTSSSCGGCTEVPFSNHDCLINLPGHGALSYDISCQPLGPWQSQLGPLSSADDGVIAGVTTPIIVTPLYGRRLETRDSSSEGAAGATATVSLAHEASAAAEADAS